MADRRVPVLKKLEKIFCPPENQPKNQLLCMYKTSKKIRLQQLFGSWTFFFRTSPKLVPSAITNRSKWGVWMACYFEKPSPETHFWGLQYRILSVSGVVGSNTTWQRPKHRKSVANCECIFWKVCPYQPPKKSKEIRSTQGWHYIYDITSS